MAKPAVLVDLWIVYEFVKRLATPWEETDAYKLGLVDENGKSLKKAKTTEEKRAMTYFDRLVFNLKRILGRVGLTSKMSTVTAALFLMKEQSNPRLPLLCDDFQWIQHGLAQQKYLLENNLVEEVPVNNVGGGAIAGTDNNPPGRYKTLGKLLRRRKILRFQDLQRGRN